MPLTLHEGAFLNGPVCQADDPVSVLLSVREGAFRHVPLPEPDNPVAVHLSVHEKSRLRLLFACHYPIERPRPASQAAVASARPSQSRSVLEIGITDVAAGLVGYLHPAGRALRLPGARAARTDPGRASLLRRGRETSWAAAVVPGPRVGHFRRQRPQLAAHLANLVPRSTRLFGSGQSGRRKRALDFRCLQRERPHFEAHAVRTPRKPQVPQVGRVRIARNEALAVRSLEGDRKRSSQRAQRGHGDQLFHFRPLRGHLICQRRGASTQARQAS